MLLNGWKQISDHVQRGVRTLQRWEGLGLPITRINQSARSPVIARSEDLDLWLMRQSNSDPKSLQLAEIAKMRRAKLHERVAALVRRREELIRAAEQITIRRVSLRA